MCPRCAKIALLGSSQSVMEEIRSTQIGTTGGATILVTTSLNAEMTKPACKSHKILISNFRGRNGKENNLLGACAEGYQGILCADCSVGYSRTGSSYKCSKCPNQADNTVKLFFLFLAMMAGIVFLVRSSLQGALQKKSFLSVFIRILMNHFQLLTITASFDLNWPE